MMTAIEDLALIGDTQTAALVSRGGAVEWLCLPRFDSGACFASLLGESRHGCWTVRPAKNPRPLRRRYRPDTLVLETELEGDDGVIRIIDFMPIRGRWPDVIRIVEGVSGRVRVDMQLVIRFDYGVVVPWVRRRGRDLVAIAGPDALVLRTPVRTRGVDLTTVASFDIEPGQRVPFVLTWHPSHQHPPPELDADAELASTERWWRDWSSRCAYRGPWRDAVMRSLITLKALTYQPTGGIVAAPTTSLPERIGGERNWDYRYCWLRDATLTLYALLLGGYQQEAAAWREWLLRAVAGDATQLRIMYGVAGERDLDERTLALPGFRGSRPVRIGNAASRQLQLDVFGELIDAMYQARRMGIPPDRWSWNLEGSVLRELATRWREPDEGIWEIRARRRHFTHSKVMAWVAFDRAVKSVEELGQEGPIDHWRATRDEIHATVLREGFDARRGTFTQTFGNHGLDASLLLIPMVGFLPPTDPRVLGTVHAIERELLVDGYVRRYSTGERNNVDGLQGEEGAFLACSFWLVDAYWQTGRRDEAEALFARLLERRNDLGLLSEEVDVARGTMLGNFPQAFSHLALVNSAYNLTRGQACAGDHRPNRGEPLPSASAPLE